MAVRSLLRYLEECEDATIDEAAMAACFAALAGVSRDLEPDRCS